MVKECPVSGVELDYGLLKGKGGTIPTSPALDRIDNSKGYIKGNIILVSSRVNRLKGENSIDELLVLSVQLINFYGDYQND